MKETDSAVNVSDFGDRLVPSLPHMRQKIFVYILLKKNTFEFEKPSIKNTLTCDQAFFFSGERESVAARESEVGRGRPPPLAWLPRSRAPTKKRTPDRRLKTH